MGERKVIDLHEAVLGNKSHFPLGPTGATTLLPQIGEKFDSIGNDLTLNVVGNPQRVGWELNANVTQHQLDFFPRFASTQL